MDFTIDIIGLTLISGAMVGLFLGSFGAGGSILCTPLLIFLVGVEDTHTAVGTSAAAVAIIALFSLVGHWRAGRVNWPCAILFSSGGLVGAVLGSTIGKTTNDNWLLLGFATVMLITGLSMFKKSWGEKNVKKVALSRSVILKIIPTGFSVGTAAGFFGIGGGFLVVPGLMLVARMGVSTAIASSLLSIALFGATTSTNYAISGLLDFYLILYLMTGGAIGGLFGLFISKFLSKHQRLTITIFAVIICIVAIFIACDTAYVLAS